MNETVDTLARCGGEVKFVELVCPLAELKRRIESPERLQYRKLSSLAVFEKLHAEGTFDTSQMPKPILTVDTSLHGPRDAALKICNALAWPN